MKKKKKHKTNEHIWRQRSLTHEGAIMAEVAMPLALQLVEKCLNNEGLAKVVLAEALFQKLELPKRTLEVQQEHRWISPASDDE